MCVLVCFPPVGKQVSVMATRMLNEMKTNEVPINTDSYNMCLEAFNLDGDLEGARLLMKRMRATCGPDLFTLVTMANLCASQGAYGEALSYLNEAMVLEAKHHDEPSTWQWRRYYVSLWPRTLRSLVDSVAVISSKSGPGKVGPIFRALASALSPTIPIDLPAIARRLLEKGVPPEGVERATGEPNNVSGSSGQERSPPPPQLLDLNGNAVQVKLDESANSLSPSSIVSTDSSPLDGEKADNNSLVS